MGQRLYDLQVSFEAAFNKLTKWRSVFAGWQLGTRVADDPECLAVKDHREISIILRAEMNALSALMIDKGLITKEEWLERCIDEARELDKLYEHRFPGFTSSERGMNMKLPEARETMKGWRK